MGVLPNWLNNSQILLEVVRDFESDRCIYAELLDQYNENKLRKHLLDIRY